jgi:folate-binding protein YgfZ
MKVISPNLSLYNLAQSKSVFVKHNRGLILGTGNDRLDLLHRLSTNSTRDLKQGDEVENILTTDKGRIFSILRILAFKDQIIMVTPDSITTDNTISWLEKYTIMDDFQTKNISKDYKVISIFGDDTSEIVTSLFGVTPPDKGKYATIFIAEKEAFIIRSNRLTGATSFSIILPIEIYDFLTNIISEVIPEIDNETYLTFRIEAGLPTFGSELNENYNPLEAGITNLISWTKGCYIGQEVIARLDTYDKVQRHLCGLVLNQNVKDHEYDLLTINSIDDDARIGTITSICFSPKLNKTICLGYIKTKYAIPELNVNVNHENLKISDALITKIPFI